MAANFENFLISLGFPLNFRKSHRILKNSLKSSNSYGLKPLGVPKDPRGLNRANVSANSKPDHPPGRPQGFARSHCPGGQVFAQLSLPGGSGFDSEKFPTVLKENAGNFRFISKKLEKQVFLRCFITIFAKTVDVNCYL